MRKFNGTVLDRAGNAVAAASVRVVLTGTSTLATLYEDDETTPKSNPMSTNSLGEYSFNVTAGTFDIQTTFAGTTYTTTKVQIDPVASAIGVSLITAVDAPAARSVLGLGSAALSSSSDFISATLFGAANGVATLGSDGKLTTAQLPALSITDTFVVNSQSAMLALVAERGDVAVRTDTNESYILAAEPAATLGNWVKIAQAPALIDSRVGFGSASNILTGSADFVWNNNSKSLQIYGAKSDPTGSLFIYHTWNNINVAFSAMKISINHVESDAGSNYILVEDAANFYNVMRVAKDTFTYRTSNMAGSGTYRVVDLETTWGNVLGTFTGISLRVTNSGSAAASRLMSLQVGGTERFSVDAKGSVAIAQETITSAATALSVTSTWNNAGAAFTGLSVAITNTASTASTSCPFKVSVGGSDVFRVFVDGSLRSVPLASSAVTGTLWWFYHGGRTAVPTGNESSLFVVEPGNVQWDTGSLATHRSIRFAAPTLSFVGASTITNAATFAIAGAPIAGTNATITNSYALWVQSGASRFDQGTITSAATALSVTSTWNNASAVFTGVSITATVTAAHRSAKSLNVVAGSSRFTVYRDSGIEVVQGATASDIAIPGLRVAGGAHTGITASTEALDVELALNRTVQFATGALSTQRAVLVSAPTYSFVGASTITTAATVAIVGEPIAGTNATITNSYALWVQSGASRFDQGTITSAATALTVTSTWNSSGTTFVGASIDVTPTASAVASSFFRVRSGSTSLLDVRASGINVISTAVAGAAPSSLYALWVAAGAHTNMTASSELNEVYFSLGNTVQWATGNFATQRFVRVSTPTCSFVGASTITNAATFAIEGSPIAGTNATLTNSYALWVQSGRTRFDQGSAASNSAYAMTVTSTWGGGATYNGLIVDITDSSSATTSSYFSVRRGGSNMLNVTKGGTSVLTPALDSATASQLYCFEVSPGAHTNVSTGEVNDVRFSIGRTVQWTSGPITTQRAVVVFAPIYSFVGASTITTAATFAISGSPTAGANATIDSAYALWVQSGASRFDQGTITTNARAALEVTSTWNAGAVIFNGIDVNVTATAYNDTSTLLLLKRGGSTGFRVYHNGGLHIPQRADNAVTPRQAMLVVPGLHTSITASSEWTAVNFDFSNVTTWATGSLTNQRFFYIGAPTIAFNGVSTVTNAATFAIYGAPIAGTNATITNSYALWVQSGASRFDQGTITAAATALSVTSTWNNAGVAFTGLDVNVADNAADAASYIARFRNDSADMLAVPYKGGIYVSQETTSGIAPKRLAYFEAQAQNNMTAGGEYQSVYFKIARTFQFATGAIATQRAFYIDAPTYAFVGASTITNAATFAISGAPIAGTNATITNSYALWVQAGATWLEGQTSINSTLVLPKTSGTGIKVDTASPSWAWRDIIGDLVARGTGAADPSWNVYRGNIRQYQFTVADELWIVYHVPHDYVPGSELHWHAHWSHISAAVTSGSATWGVDVSYSKGHNQGAFPATSNFTIAQAASTTQYQHMVAEVQITTSGQIGGVDVEADGLILVRVYLSANTINGTPEPFLHTADIHYQSTNVGTKAKAPNFWT